MPQRNHQITTEQIIADIEDGSRTTPPTREELDEDSYSTIANLVQQLISVSNKIVELIQAKPGQLSATERIARLRADWFINTQNTLASGTRDQMIDSLVMILGYYLEVK
jgi:hypothetical protein